ncbi:MAG: aminotransferase class I/II-fold pyridoxal phosphate-dependent enzyme [Methylacidiphilales bacterium]|nr:aminotransferase class I/II-fold pyridoxal phosphate-dependent enzyme [Candidatus Methylacidiphilales bacterium]
MPNDNQKNSKKPLGFSTRAIRVGWRRSHRDAHHDPLILTSSFRFESAEDGADRFAKRSSGDIYTRFTNPNCTILAEKIASLEGAQCAVTTATGMAAINACFLGLCGAGDHVVVAEDVFGGTSTLVDTYLPKYGIEVTRVPVDSLDLWRSSIRKNTKLFFLESPTNPLLKVADIPGIAQIAKNHKIIVVVDNCLPTPALSQPLSLGATIITHSGTKFLEGHGRTLGGVIAGPSDLVGEVIYQFIRNSGPSLSPFNAWVISSGLSTLELRMNAMSANALRIAEFLLTQPNVSKVHYPTLPGNKFSTLCAAQIKSGTPLVSFVCNGGREKAFSFLNKLEIISLSANLGDVKTMATHPATTTHARLRDEQKLAYGIEEGLIRISVGLETVSDLVDDISSALA